MLAGLRRSRCRKQGVTTRVPPGAGVGEVSDEKRGVDDLAVASGEQFAASAAALAPVDSGATERGEGGGVAAGLGGEVAAEAEHVRPAAQPPIQQSVGDGLASDAGRVLVGFTAAERPAGLDQSAHMITTQDGGVDVLCGEPAGGMPGGFGALGG